MVQPPPDPTINVDACFQTPLLHNLSIGTRDTSWPVKLKPPTVPQNYKGGDVGEGESGGPRNRRFSMTAFQATVYQSTHTSRSPAKQFRDSKQHPLTRQSQCDSEQLSPKLHHSPFFSGRKKATGRGWAKRQNLRIAF